MRKDEHRKMNLESFKFQIQVVEMLRSSEQGVDLKKNARVW